MVSLFVVPVAVDLYRSLCKKDVTHEMLHERLYGVFQDTGVDVWQSEFVQ